MTKLSTKRILVPIDFSKTSERAIKHAAFIAKLTKGELFLLHVLKKNDLFDMLLPTLNLENPDIVMDFAVEKMEELGATIKKEYGIKVSTIVATGHITSEIVEETEENKIGLVVMGTQGADSPNSGLFLGSNTYRVVHNCEVPVLAVRTETAKVGYSTILVAIDTSPQARQKVITSIDFAEKFGARVHVLGLLTNSESSYEHSMNTIMKQVEKLAEKKGLPHTSEVKHTKNHAKDTLSVAKKIKADMIMVTENQHAGMSRLFYGSYTHQLLNESKIPVMCFTPEKHDEMMPTSLGGMW